MSGWAHFVKINSTVGGPWGLLLRALEYSVHIIGRIRIVGVLIFYENYCRFDAIFNFPIFIEISLLTSNNLYNQDGVNLGFLCFYSSWGYVCMKECRFLVMYICKHASVYTNSHRKLKFGTYYVGPVIIKKLISKIF